MLEGKAYTEDLIHCNDAVLKCSVTGYICNFNSQALVEILRYGRAQVAFVSVMVSGDDMLNHKINV